MFPQTEFDETDLLETLIASMTVVSLAVAGDGRTFLLAATLSGSSRCH